MLNLMTQHLIASSLHKKDLITNMKDPPGFFLTFSPFVSTSPPYRFNTNKLHRQYFDHNSNVFVIASNVYSSLLVLSWSAKENQWKRQLQDLKVSVQAYVLRSSGISRKSGALTVRYNQKKEWISFVFYC